MKYMLLIHQGDTPTPRDPDAWAHLSEEEQKAVYDAYRSINETPASAQAKRWRPLDRDRHRSGGRADRPPAGHKYPAR
jgi:hypothetical protein